MSATLSQSTTPAPVLYLAFELGWGDWKLAFSTGLGDAPRLRAIGARKLEAIGTEIAKAKKRLGLPANAVVRSCYEAGRDGFWLHRYLEAQGVANLVVDSASIEVNRRSRRAKTDRLDAAKLAQMLIRYHLGETRVWKLVRVLSVADEDARQLHRDLLEMKAERTQHVNRIKGLLAGCGVATEVDAQFLKRLAALRDWNGAAVPEQLQQRLQDEFARWQFVDAQIREREAARARRTRSDAEPRLEPVRKLLCLRGVGLNSAWLLVHELFGWRQIQNRRELAALTGLAPTPYASGNSDREQGISKAGNRRVRTMLVELAWCWLRYQPKSQLSRWFAARFGSGGSRQRRIGIVAVARKLVVALWRYLERGEVPADADVVSWQSKLGKCRVRPRATAG